MLLWGLSLPLFAQSPRAETVEPALQSLDSKLDVILRRLDAIEKRLGRLEGQRNVPMPPSEAAKQNETSVILVPRERIEMACCGMAPHFDICRFTLPTPCRYKSSYKVEPSFHCSTQ
jgi:hypothetical protein